MKYCQHCGKEVNDNAVVCVNCGCALTDQKYENKAIGILSIIFGALIGWVGLVLSIIGLCTYKDKINRRNSAIGLGLSVAWVAFYIVNRIFHIVAFFA